MNEHQGYVRGMLRQSQGEVHNIAIVYIPEVFLGFYLSVVGLD